MVIYYSIIRGSLKMEQPHLNGIWTAFEPHLNRIWTAFEPHLNCIWSAFKLHLNCIWTAFKLHLNCIWTAFELHLNCIEPKNRIYCKDYYGASESQTIGVQLYEDRVLSVEPTLTWHVYKERTVDSITWVVSYKTLYFQ